MPSIAENMKRLRALRGLSQAALAERSGVSQQLISQLENGKNAKTTELPSLAAALDVGVHEIDEDFTPDIEGIPTAIVPVLSWVSAGTMLLDDIRDEAKGAIRVASLPPTGDWIGLQVVGDSMDRISPPDSIIIVDRKDKRLVTNACYVIADVDGNATYKRYRQNPVRFEPVSTNPKNETIYPDQDPLIVGRVRRSILEM
ncbi:MULTISPECIES: LexA family protein [unclassified Rhizobium]|uniref:LexA family protein n=1 Tax=unclassified Rhizobium TaxID=2613769 RepID=UPI001ADB76DC|nr:MULTISPECIES: helix-turn-helix domain-containing protein [unclassified Rhizobium]MBO9099470.1 helix-turn-helix domain-containing protein [Rhizobium sp. L58/93]QXZ87047.1 helix-turn-helix domain-containing protein [Rhizobium sp. K1/93]QXZ92919.1 helix-turn-helix domain-containing protein [Rhizobium sp. K15/93]